MPEVMPVLTTPQDPENSASLNPLSVPSSNNLSVSPPGQSPEISSFKRKVSQQFCESFGLSKNLENEDPNLLLTDDAISSKSIADAVLKVFDIAKFYGMWSSSFSFKACGPSLRPGF